MGHEDNVPPVTSANGGATNTEANQVVHQHYRGPLLRAALGLAESTERESV